MSRKSFIESHGATCRNWRWSWSFINDERREVIFGAWDRDTSGGRAMILDEKWSTNSAGRKFPAYTEAREYLRRVEEDGYALLTFPMVFSARLQDASGSGPARIDAFVPELTPKALVRVGPRWYACDAEYIPCVAEELQNPELYSEGARKTITINAFERNRAARAACLAHHGRRCVGCGFDGISRYGALGEGVIHVHHIVPVAEIRQEYELNPITDLVPLCPNCHAVVHSTRPALTVSQLREALRTSTEA